MKPDSSQISPKLEAVLVRLCEKAGPLTKTRAVKLPYLVDVLAQRALGRPIAGGHYETWDYGVVTKEVFRFIQHTGGNEALAVEPHRYSEGGLQIRRAGPAQEVLSAAELEIVDLVAELYGRLDAGRLGSLTKAMNTHLGPEAWGSNRKPSLDEDAYARLAEGWQTFSERLPSLDLRDRSKWGSPIVDPARYLVGALGA